MRRRRAALLATLSASALLVAAMAPEPATAQTNWLGGTSNNWNTGANWSTGTPPTAGNDVTINTTTPNPTVLTGSGVAGTGSARTIVLGGTGTGNLSVLSGATLTSSGAMSIGDQAGQTGTVTIDGTGTTYTVTSSGGEIIVGNSGTGKMTISNDAVVTTNWAGHGLKVGNLAGSTSPSTIDITTGGIFRTDGVEIGIGSDGVMTVGDRGQFFAGTIVLGSILTSMGSGSGTLTVTDGGSVSNAYFIIGGPSSDGLLTVESGGTVTTSGNVTITGGPTGGGTATVRGDWTVRGGRGIRLYGTAGLGNATLNIENGGTVSAFRGVDFQNGTLNLSGASSTLQTGSLAVTAGTGQATFNGGTLRANFSTSPFITGFNSTTSLLTIEAGGLTVDPNGLLVATDQTSGFTGPGALTVGVSGGSGTFVS